MLSARAGRMLCAHSWTSERCESQFNAGLVIFGA